MTEREYMHILKLVIDGIFKHWDGKISDFAKEAGLCDATIRRMLAFSGKRPQFRTIVRMARAAGVSVYIDHSTGKVKVAA